MSEYITSTQETINDFGAQLSQLWNVERLVLVNTFGRMAMYETFDWDPRAAGFDTQPLALSKDCAGRRSAINVTSFLYKPTREEIRGPYPVDTVYGDLFFIEKKDRLPALNIPARRGAIYHLLSGEVHATYERALAHESVRTLSIAAHLELERLVLATGSYSELPEQRAKDVAEFAAFADHIRHKGKHHKEFPDRNVLLPFSTACRELYDIGRRHDRTI